MSNLLICFVVFENYTWETVLENGQVVSLVLVDTAGQEDYDKVRSTTSHSYKPTYMPFTATISTIQKYATFYLSL